MIRLLPALAVLLLAIMATWMIARGTAPSPPTPTPVPEVAAVPTATSAPITPASAATTPSPGHRLAGTVVGDLQFAVIEAPDGSNELYAIDDQVPGLGKLIAIGSNSATFEGSDGQFEMPLLAAPTPTARPRRASDRDEELEDEDLLYQQGGADEDEYQDDEYRQYDEPYEDGEYAPYEGEAANRAR